MELSDVAKITKKRYKAQTTTVLTKKDLAEVLKARYERIIVKDALGKRLYNEMNGFNPADSIRDMVVNAFRDNLKDLTKLLKDYKMISSNDSETIIVLKEEKKGFQKK